MNKDKILNELKEIQTANDKGVVSSSLLDLQEVIDTIYEYGVLEAAPEGDFELGYHMACQGLINIFKTRALK